MGIFNYYGLIIIVLILLPNIAFAALNKDGFKNAYENKPLEICEQIGRFGCFILMIVNVPYTYFGFRFNYALAAYLAVNGRLRLCICSDGLCCGKNRECFARCCCR